MTVYILGGGPAGMAIADGLIDANGEPFVILERGDRLGGLAQSVPWDDAGVHDLGPHKIFSLDQALVKRIENLLPAADWLTRDKVSSIYMRGHYLPYPPSPFSLAGVFGLPAFIKMVIGYGFAKIRSLLGGGNPGTFEEDLQGRLGAPLYEILFKPIAVKLWGDPKQLDVKLSKGRVQTPSLAEVLGRLLKIKTSSEFEALTFRYPKGGLGRLWDAIEAKGKSKGEFRLHHTVTGLEVQEGRVSRIHYTANNVTGTFELGADDYVVSSLPLALLARLLGNALPAHIPTLAEKVVALNDLLLVFLHVDVSSLVKESWVFIPDPAIAFHRLSEQESFDPGMTPHGSIVCCEIMSSDTRAFAQKTDEELCDAALKGLADMGYSGFKVLKQKVIRLPKSYPVFRPGYEDGLAEIIQNLDGFQNLRTIGRQGAFNYIGTLDAMDIGYGFAKWLSAGRKQSWQQERDRTNHYPVLD
jgi:protoporphyrinogen oxidase